MANTPDSPTDAERYREALRLVADIATGSQTINSLPHIAQIAREALDLPKTYSSDKRLQDLVECLLENDPNDLAADGGVTVLDVWRKDAARALGRSSKPSEPTS